MPIKILMPALSPTMTEGTLAKWLVAEGDDVSSGDVLAEIETDKATMEVEAVEEGRVGKLVVSEGSEGVKVNETIALLLEDGEDASALEGAGAAAAPAASALAPTAPRLQRPRHRRRRRQPARRGAGSLPVHWRNVWRNRPGLRYPVFPAVARMVVS